MRDNVYEDYEPEVRIWPYMLFALVFSITPFVFNMLPLFAAGNVGFIHYVWSISSAIAIFLFLFSAAKILRSGKGSSIFLWDGLLWAFSVTLLWAYNTYMGKAGYALSIPFLTALSPSYVFLLAYSYYRKRRGVSGLGINLLALLLSVASFAYLYKTTGAEGFVKCVYLAYPALTTLIAIFTLVASRYTESTPFMISIGLAMLSLAALFMYGDFGAVAAAVAKVSPAEGLKMLLYYFFKSLQSNFALHLSLASCFVFDAISKKTSIADYSDDYEEEYFEEVHAPVKEEEDISYEEEIPRPRANSNPIQDQEVLREFEEWKEFRRLKASSVRYERYEEPAQEEPAPREEEPKHRERESVRRRRYGEELDSEAKDKWYDLLRGEIPDDEFNLKS